MSIMGDLFSGVGGFIDAGLQGMGIDTSGVTQMVDFPGVDSPDMGINIGAAPSVFGTVQSGFNSIGDFIGSGGVSNALGVARAAGGGSSSSGTRSNIPREIITARSLNGQTKDMRDPGTLKGPAGVDPKQAYAEWFQRMRYVAGNPQ